MLPKDVAYLEEGRTTTFCSPIIVQGCWTRGLPLSRTAIRTCHGVQPMRYRMSVHIRRNDGTAFDYSVELFVTSGRSIRCRTAVTGHSRAPVPGWPRCNGHRPLSTRIAHLPVEVLLSLDSVASSPESICQ
ncbi:hypothetical protein CONLIGDRAFT_113329 [Coniochaeta ligniaria NRRL 30616]|uniref:Uncharacterized protein n=1 Tax=Coniochaeta ligniaria NRRL 30616 TaxID=1408157 RepID=A0A1J7J3Y0_9PEZI|nr:hypothetical protein CONLIGDRAFT_113329 [Coniochaeta ligniaria NRRL 30616]